MFENTQPQTPPQQKPEIPHDDEDAVQIPISKAEPSEIPAPPPQKADLKRIPGHKKVWIIFSVIAGVIVIGVGGVFAAHLSGIINIPLVDTILQRNTVSIATFADKFASVQSAQSDVDLTFAVEPASVDAKSIPGDYLQGTGVFLPTDLNLTLHVHSFMGTESDKPTGNLQLSGSYISGGTSLSADVEARLINGAAYIRANTLPSIPSLPTDQIVGKWIEVSSAADVEQQLENYSLPVTLPAQPPFDSQEAERSVESVMNTAESTGFATLSKRLSVEEFNGVKYNRYVLDFDQTQLDNFVQTFLMNERDYCKAHSDCFLSGIDGSNFGAQTDSDITDIVGSLTSDQSASELVSLLTDATTYEVWIANDNSAYRLIFSLIVDGRSVGDQLAGKQIRLTVASTVSHINEQPQVETPTPELTIDDIERIFQGYSIDEWNIVQQENRIDELRSALTAYKEKNGSYPTALSDLETDANSTDMFTKVPYIYSSDGASYTLQYQIKKPDGTTITNDIMKDVVIGTNTADMYVVSREAESERDSDSDGLTGAQELQNGTNPLLADTDKDGASDLEEIQAGTDPLDPESNPSTDIGVDTDGDGLTDAQESLYGTNPKLKDTDLDGYSDKNEIDAGYNPLSASLIKTYGMRVSDSDWVRGASDAKITVVSFCSFADASPCLAYYTYLDGLLTSYPNDVRIVYKQYPKETSSSALACAGAQGKYFEMHDKMLTEGKNYTVAAMNIWAEDIGLDTTVFADCLNNRTADTQINNDLQYADALDLQATPVTLINGTQITGIQTSLITDEIEKQLDALSVGNQ